MERSEHNDENVNAPPHWLIHHQNEVPFGDNRCDQFGDLEITQAVEEYMNEPGTTDPQNQLTTGSSWVNFETAQLESFTIPTEEFFNDNEALPFQNQVIMSNRYFEIVSPQTEMTIQAGNSVLEEVSTSSVTMAASVESLPLIIFVNESQPGHTVYQLVEFTAEEASASQLPARSSPLPQIHPRPGHIFCTICKPYREVLKKNKDGHIISHHIDTYFISAKQPNVSQTDFKEYCDYVVKENVLLSKIIVEKEKNPYLKCGCGTCCFTTNLEISMRSHFCRMHKEVAEKRLSQLQRDTASVTEIREKASKLKTSCFADGDYFRCSNCDKKFKTSQNLREHKKKVCRSNLDNYVLCKFCDSPKSLKIRSLINHNVNYHIEKLLESSKAEDLSDEDYKKECEFMMKQLLRSEMKSDDGKEWVCPFCSKALSAQRIISLRYHLYNMHKEVLLKKMSNLDRGGSTAMTSQQAKADQQ